ncbi:uncharacterized protein LOC102712877 [Oryza brachyantha]|uniref:uncharacterized protein LOC102712877 n=1 Tax=Oryza brachyantha TaxID=4533 RepID=UPI001ADB04C7|nr:uncharacterized protein LOC102712877 [Oryza brachyantha]
MHKSKGKLSGVLHKGFKPDKCKTALRMALARIKLLRNRKEVQVRQMRRDVAQLLEADQDQTARIRVEHVIREEKFMQAYDLIEVYCELMVARMSIIDSQKTCPIDLKEAIASVIFASMRCSDVTELVDVRKHFTSKYGKEFAAAALEVRPDSGVSRLVIEKLSAGAPDTQTKIKTLTSIAEEHNIKWEPKAFEEKLQKQNDNLLHGTTTYSGGNIPTRGSADSSSGMPTSQPAAPSYSYMESSNSHMPTAHSYSSAEVPDNRAPFVTANPNGSMPPSFASPNASMPPSLQHGATAYSSAQIPVPNSSSHVNAGRPDVSRPHSQYDTDTTSGRKEFNQSRERKSSVSGSNWNIEFKDATSAAQAAAESAEMASIAARAAAQLASRGNFSAEQNTGAFESPSYIHETTPRKQQAEHFMEGQRSFNEQSSGAYDPRLTSSNARKDGERAETSRVGNQNMSTHSSGQYPDYSPLIHSDEYGMPTELHRTDSPGHQYSDDSSEKVSNFERPDDHQFNLPGERLFDAQLGGHNIKDTESKEPNFDQENTDDYYSNYSSSHVTFTHGSSTIWDSQNDKNGPDSSAFTFDKYDSDVGEENLLDHFSSKHTEESTVEDHKDSSAYVFDHYDSDVGEENLLDHFSSKHTEESTVDDRKDPSASVFDQYDSDVGEENVLDHVSSKHTEESTVEDHKGFSNADWGQQHRNEYSVNHSTSTLFSRTEENPSYNLEANRKDVSSPHSRGSGFSESKEDIISGKVVHNVNVNIEDLESKSRNKYVNSSGSNTSAKERYGQSSLRSDYSWVDGELDHTKMRDLEEEERIPHKLEGASSEITGENKNQPFSLGRQTSASSADYDEGDLGLNFGKLTPGLRNKLRQPPPYRKDSEDNMLPKQLLHKVPAAIGKSVHSEENDTLSENTRNASTSMARSSLDENYNNELYDQYQSVGARVEARSTMRRHYFESEGDRGKLSEQSFNAPSSGTNKSSGGVNSSQDLYHEKSGVGARRVTKTTKTYFDSDDSEDELAQREKVQTKWSGEQIKSRRTREMASDTKRETGVQVGVQHADKTEAKSPTGSFTGFTEQRRESPVYSRAPVPRTSPKPVRVDPPLGKGKSQEAGPNTVSVTRKEESTQSPAEAPKESTPKTAPAHVHPKLPTDYDSFAAHFMSLRTKRR